VLYILLKYSQNRLKKLFSSRLKKGQEKANGPIHFISRKLSQKGQIRLIWPFKRSNGNPVLESMKL
jgi:hypothetical protein